MLQCKLEGVVVKWSKILGFFLLRLIVHGSKPKHFLIESLLGANIRRSETYGLAKGRHITSGQTEPKNPNQERKTIKYNDYTRFRA